MFSAQHHDTAWVVLQTKRMVTPYVDNKLVQPQTLAVIEDRVARAAAAKEYADVDAMRRDVHAFLHEQLEGHLRALKNPLNVFPNNMGRSREATIEYVEDSIAELHSLLRKRSAGQPSKADLLGTLRTMAAQAGESIGPHYAAISRRGGADTAPAAAGAQRGTFAEGDEVLYVMDSESPAIAAAVVQVTYQSGTPLYKIRIHDTKAERAVEGDMLFPMVDGAGTPVGTPAARPQAATRRRLSIRSSSSSPPSSRSPSRSTRARSTSSAGSGEGVVFSVPFGGPSPATVPRKASPPRKEDPRAERHRDRERREAKDGGDKERHGERDRHHHRREREREREPRDREPRDRDRERRRRRRSNSHDSSGRRRRERRQERSGERHHQHHHHGSRGHRDRDGDRSRDRDRDRRDGRRDRERDRDRDRHRDRRSDRPPHISRQRSF